VHNNVVCACFGSPQNPAIELTWNQTKVGIICIVRGDHWWFDFHTKFHRDKRIIHTSGCTQDATSYEEYFPCGKQHEAVRVRHWTARDFWRHYSSDLDLCVLKMVLIFWTLVLWSNVYQKFCCRRLILMFTGVDYRGQEGCGFFL
jgi:hypothetical protein